LILNRSLKQLVADLSLDKVILLDECLQKGLKPTRKRVLVCAVTGQFPTGEWRACGSPEIESDVVVLPHHE